VEKSEREKFMLDTLTEIAKWPDNGTRYGQKNIKRYAKMALVHLASIDQEALEEAKKKVS
jgi:hypothetical protein